MSQPYDPYRGDPRRPYQEPYAPRQQYAPPRPPAPQGPPAPPPSVRRPRQLPGLGLLLTVLGLVVQVLSLTVLPWVSYSGTQPFTFSMSDIRDATSTLGTHGFGAWYVVLFSYPLAALGVLLALAAVLNSVAAKVIWGGLALIGLGLLVLRYGLWPFAEPAVTDNDHLDFTRQEATTAIIALAGLVAVIFMLRTALSMFRRVAGLILLGLAGVHVAAVLDLVKDSSSADLSIGAYGPVLGYLLLAVAALLPRSLPGV